MAVRVGESTCLRRLVRQGSGKVVGIVANVHEYNGSFLLFAVFGECLLRGNISISRVVRVTLSNVRGRRLESPGMYFGCVGSTVGSSKGCCLLLSRIRFVPQFRRILGDLLHVDGVSICIAKDGSGFLSDSVIARFHNENSRVEVCPLSFTRFCSICSNSCSST